MLDPDWRKLTNDYIRGQLERDGRLQKLQQLIPKEIRIPKPGEIPALIQGLREAIWGAVK